MNLNQIRLVRFRGVLNPPFKFDPDEDEVVETPQERSKRVERILKNKIAKEYIDETFRRTFAPRVFKFLGFDMQIPIEQKILHLEEVLPKNRLIQLRLRVPQQLLRNALYKKRQADLEALQRAAIAAAEEAANQREKRKY